jgi:1,4-alpha-glucan branching enzyme
MIRPSLSEAIDRLARGTWGDPFAVLGPHVEKRDGTPALIIRAVRPDAAGLAVVRSGASGREVAPMTRRHDSGVFEAVYPGETATFPYRLLLTRDDGSEVEFDDPYRFGQVMGELDLHLLGEGNHHRSFEKLGSHVMTVDGVGGVYFAVWAPNASRVSVVGDFCQWDGRYLPMRRLVPNGIWELFVPGLDVGTVYKYEVQPPLGGLPMLKADPFARYAEVPPATASIVWDAGRYRWRDSEWLRHRAAGDAWMSRPMAIYEVHLGSWARDPDDPSRYLSYREIASRLVAYVKEMGFTHIELLPVAEHPFTGSWGYQVTGFFAPTSRFGPPEDFKFFVDECHVNGIGVIVDWVPGHFPRDAHGLARFDGTALYEHDDPRVGGAPGLGHAHLQLRAQRGAELPAEQRALLAGGVPRRRPARGRGGLDALPRLLAEGRRVDPEQVRRAREPRSRRLPAAAQRADARQASRVDDHRRGVDGVARGEPADVGRWARLHLQVEHGLDARHPRVRPQGPALPALEPQPGDVLDALRYNENFILPFSHDEVVHGKASMLSKMPGDDWQKAANLRALYGYMYAHPGKKLMFMGGEFGQWLEWDEDTSLPWHVVDEPPHRGIRRFVKDLTHLYRRELPLHEADYDPSGFQWIDCNDSDNSVVSFIRRSREGNDIIIVVVNFTPVVREGYRVGVPGAGLYVELLNSDSEIYGGSNKGNAGAVHSEAIPAHGFPQSLRLVLPPLAIVFLKWQR